MITRWQALEYISGAESGAARARGAWLHHRGAGRGRRLAARGVRALGRLPTDTLAEDQDLTIAMLRAGYKVHFDSTAIAWTEAPDTLRGLAKQRFRWAFGTLQCLWKHRRMTFNPRYGVLGLVALPQVWLFQILLPLLAPLVDLALIWQLAMSIYDLQHPRSIRRRYLRKVLIYYLRLHVRRPDGAAIALAMERRRGGVWLWWLVLQRFGYRQLMYYVVVRRCWPQASGRSSAGASSSASRL